MLCNRYDTSTFLLEIERLEVCVFFTVSNDNSLHSVHKSKKVPRILRVSYSVRAGREYCCIGAVTHHSIPVMLIEREMRNAHHYRKKTTQH